MRLFWLGVWDVRRAARGAWRASSGRRRARRGWRQCRGAGQTTLAGPTRATATTTYGRHQSLSGRRHTSLCERDEAGEQPSVRAPPMPEHEVYHLGLRDWTDPGRDATRAASGSTEAVACAACRHQSRKIKPR